MKTSLKILLATDYSEAVMNAERYAIQFALQNDSFLQILHVFKPPTAEAYPVFDAEKIDYNPVLFEMKKLKEHVNGILQALNIEPGLLRHQNVIREGLSAAIQISAEAKEMNADLIVIGTHGETGYRQFMLGNHTWNVIKKAEVPVLSIPKHGLFTGIKNVVFVTEYRESEIPVIDYLAQFVEQFQAELTVLHISNTDIGMQFEKEIADPFLEKLKRKIKYPHVNIRVIHHDDVIEGLNTFCTNVRADWIATSIERLSLLERIFTPANDVAKDMSFDTHIPLFTIPDAYGLKKRGVPEKRSVGEIAF